MTSKECKISPHVPISWGELLDKITILEIKQSHARSSSARENISFELRQLESLLGDLLTTNHDIAKLVAELRGVNRLLWNVEDAIRQKEASRDFGQEFIELARSVYLTNDSRARIKRKINEHLNSAIVEEKVYQSY
jgi:hypothetical protein